jgi:hypothetical protein
LNAYVPERRHPQAAREALDPRPPHDEPRRAQHQEHEARDGEDEPADRELLVAEDVRGLLEERQVAGVALARQPAQMEVVEEAHDALARIVDAEQPARARVDVGLALVLVAVDEVDAVAVHDVVGLERRRLAADDRERLGVADRVLGRGRPVQLGVDHPVDLPLVQEHDAADHDGEQRQPEDERQPPVGEDEHGAHGRPPPAPSRRRRRRGLGLRRRGRGRFEHGAPMSRETARAPRAGESIR